MAAVGACRDNAGMRKILIVAVVMAAGCGRPQPATLGEAVQEVATPLCQRAVECGDITSAEEGDCEAKITQSICNTEQCSEAPKNWPNISHCIDVVGTSNCAYLANGTTPGACQGVLF